MSDKHFLVWRDIDFGVRKILVYSQQQTALDGYAHAESFLRPGEEVCLFGSDSLATLCQTHPAWVCPETLNAPLFKEIR